MSISIAIIGLVVSYIIGHFQITSRNGLDIKRNYNNVPNLLSALLFAVVVMVFIFIEHWGSILQFMIETTGTRTPTAGTLLSPWIIIFISGLYAVICYDFGRVASALRIQKIIERRWLLRYDDEFSDDDEEEGEE